jgi:hypothetical protein
MHALLLRFGGCRWQRSLTTGYRGITITQEKFFDLQAGET